MEYTDFIDKVWKYLPIAKTIYDKFRRIFRKKYDKSNAFILFIDDNDFPIVQALKDEQWSVERIKDLRDINDVEIKRAQIIFVDYKGVGKKLSKELQGMAVVNAIKKQYGNTKRVVLYSGYRWPTKQYLKDGPDALLTKDSELYEFIQTIEVQLRELK